MAPAERPISTGDEMEQLEFYCGLALTLVLSVALMALAMVGVS